MADDQNYGLLISAVVSIVAVVGMVVLFSSGAYTGRMVDMDGALKGASFDTMNRELEGKYVCNFYDERCNGKACYLYGTNEVLCADSGLRVVSDSLQGPTERTSRESISANPVAIPAAGKPIYNCQQIGERCTNTPESECGTQCCDVNAWNVGTVRPVSERC